MSYLGNQPDFQAFAPAIDYFSGNGSTTSFTLSRPVGSVAQLVVVVANVVQNPSSAYTVSGNTITFTGAPPAGTNNIWVNYTSPITQLMQPSDGSVTDSKIVSVAASKLTGSRSLPASVVPAGSVIQVVQVTATTAITNSSSTYTSTGLSAAITPASSSNKIYVVAYCPLRFGASNNQTGGLRINRGGTIVMADRYANNVSAIVDISYPITLAYLDSPNSNSSQTYTVEFASVSSSSPYGYPTVNFGGSGSNMSTLTLMEIAA